ncbi:MAG TPA: type II toxin-antitoxin system death-on-curing family toxin, partial [Aggregatilineales bacterium]|nr:type II toxin-antitoxin system death-on-curing family toxin [Aggregatilineales bacterium]
SAFGSDAYPSIFEKAAALLDSLSRNHPFVDGNKRTATAALILFLDENGYRVTWKPEEALEFILAVAQGQRDIVTIAAWLKENSSPLETDS